MFNVLSIDGGVCAPSGFFANGLSANLKGEGKLDVAYIYSKEQCNVGAIFTSNKFRAAPIKHFLKYPSGFMSNFVLINSKNANAMTGKKGVSDIDYIFNALVAQYPNICNPIASSTGVIGVPIPKEKIINVFSKIDFEAKNAKNAAQAIMTTDRYPKEIALEVQLENNKSYKIGAMCKGAGMINPNLATMLCFITTDACVPKDEMHSILQQVAKTTFNAISVDGDTSTNDTILLLSNQQSGVWDRESFIFALEIALKKLALDVVSDGEGAKKLVAFEVRGAKNDLEAEHAAKCLSQSLLVKTALFGEDPNWGRIASTIGASGVECDEEKLSITFLSSNVRESNKDTPIKEGISVYKRGEIHFDTQIEKKAALVLKEDSFRIICDLGVGKSCFVAYGCDLGYEYVKINADYRS